MNIPEIEKKILEFWEKEKIFEKSLNNIFKLANFILCDRLSQRSGYQHN